MKKIVIALSVSFLSAASAFCAFKDVNWSVRSSGMGGAFVAVADDASSPLINPAGIIQIKNSEADFMYTKLFNGLDDVDLAMQYASVEHSLGKYGNAGITWASFNTKDVYNETTVAYTHSIDISQLNHKLPGILLGANIKFLSHRYITDDYTVDDPVFVNGTSKWGVTADLGALYFPMPNKLPDFSVGMAIKNITQPDLGLASADIVPMEARGGAAFGIPAVNILDLFNLYDVILAADVDYRAQEWGTLDNKLSEAVGTEFWVLNKTVGLRLGAATQEASAGVSFKFNIANNFGVRFAYAVNFPFYLTGSTGNQRGSFLVKF